MEAPKNWIDINEDMPNLLFGNGLGRTYWGGFAYDSLLETFGDRPVGRYLCTKDLFNKLKTSNFEEVLRAIYHAHQVSIDNLNATKTLYLDVQKALINAVNNVHPKPDDVPSEKLGECLSAYRNIFTTNYDLLPYWAILSGQSHRIVDYFWGESGSFNIKDSSVNQGKSPIHFLHGALHLRSESILEAHKVSIAPQSGAADALNSDFSGTFPLFITEGKSELKMSRIRSNAYLNFCYEKLCKTDGGLVIYGHDMSTDYDNHIIDAVRLSNNKKIAVSVFSDLGDAEKLKFMARIVSSFVDLNKDIIFFESSTHPIAQCRA